MSPGEPNQPIRNPWLILVILCLGFFMILLDTTIVNIAVPKMSSGDGGLNLSLDQVLWVINAYLLVYAVLLITAGRLGDLWGPRLMFAIGLVVFVVASAACGLAQDGNQMIAARIVQGVGGAMLTPQTLTIITSIFPPERRGAAFGVWGAVAGVATIAGPTLGGFLVADVDWRWIFYVNLPIGIVALVGTFLFVPDIRPGRRHRLDLVGVGLATVGLLGIVFGLVEGQRYDWGALVGVLTIPEVIAVGVVFLIVFVFWETRQEEPLVPLRLFRNRNYSIMIWVSSVLAFGMLGLFLPLSIFMQTVLGMDALHAGLALAPMSLISIFVAPVAGRFADRVGGKYILITGLVLFSSGMGWIALTITVDSTWLTFLVPAIVAGIGLGMTFAPLIATAMRDIQPQMAGAASGVLNTTRQVGGVIGSAVVGAVLQNQMASSLHREAVARSGPLGPYQQKFVDGIDQASHAGFRFAPSAPADLHLPPGMPPAQAQAIMNSIKQIGQSVFAHGFTNAVRPTLAVPIAVIAMAALSCLALEHRHQATARARATEEPAAATE